MKQTYKTIILSVSILGILLLAVVTLLLLLGVTSNSSSRSVIPTQISDNRYSSEGQGFYISSTTYSMMGHSSGDYNGENNNVAPNNPTLTQPNYYPVPPGPIQGPTRNYAPTEPANNVQAPVTPQTSAHTNPGPFQAPSRALQTEPIASL